jgi:DNA modification methylase
VLDPFAGLGTTSAAARAWGRNSIAIESEERYFDSMADRMSTAERPEGEITISRWPMGAARHDVSVAMPAV